MAIKTAVHEDRVLLHTDWSGYLKILDALGESPGVRVTYDSGSLEIMTLGAEHEHVSELIAHLMVTYMLDREMSFHLGGAQTFKRKDRERGFEPDKCFWIQHWETMLGQKKWDHRRHPPPDLALETEITSPFLPRQPIYAAIGVPEVWWYRDDKIKLLRLTEQGTYERVAASPTFPELPVRVMEEHLRQANRVGDALALGSFTTWLRSARR